jgi:hypothetical protein
VTAKIIAAAIDAAVRDPKFVAAFEDALMNVHESMGRAARPAPVDRA